MNIELATLFLVDSAENCMVDSKSAFQFWNKWSEIWKNAVNSSLRHCIFKLVIQCILT